MSRQNIAMSAAELQTFLNTIEWVALGTLNSKGDPVGDVAPVVIHGDTLHFAVAADSESHNNLLRDARCCCCADVFPTYKEIKGATVHGIAQLVTPPKEVATEIAVRAKVHELRAEIIYALPLLGDAFGFDFAKLNQ